MTFLSLLQAALLLAPIQSFKLSPISLGTKSHFSTSVLSLQTRHQIIFPPTIKQFAGLSTDHHRHYRPSSSYSTTTTTAFHAKPKRGNIVDSYQTVSVNCSKCGTRLFRYKKKNGTKSNLVKLYVERISEDCAGLLQQQQEQLKDNSTENESSTWECPNCQTNFARSATIHGRPALKLVGGKIRMTKK